ncbi:MAG: hypothetical protein D6773_12440, partial [Alphaproteobacteria bacterium]
MYDYSQMKEAFSRPLRRAGGAASALLMFAALLLAAAGVSANEPMTLDAVRERVMQDYPAVSQISTGEAAELMARDDGVLLFDVREADEYAVSRIPGAIRVDPGIWTF